MNNKKEQREAISFFAKDGMTVEQTIKHADQWLDLCANPDLGDGVFNSAIKHFANEKANVDDIKLVGKDQVFKTVDKAIIVGVNEFYNTNDVDLDKFRVAAKRCYNKPNLREHLMDYLNYFEKFYDRDMELVAIYSHIKVLMDYIEEYDVENLIFDLKKYIIYNKSILSKIFMMNEDNYMVPLKRRKGKSIENLQYDTKHGKILMQMALLMDMVIPIVSHFASLKKVENINDLMLKIFDIILSMSDVDIFNKLYETSSYEVEKNEKINSVLWEKQDIRGKDTVTHALNSINNIILNIMPKYRYDMNIISLNSMAIRNNTGYKVTDIKYEYNLRSLRSSDRDDDFNSEFDKYEAYQIIQDEALYLQNKVNCEATMMQLEQNIGPISDEEIQYFTEKLQEDGNTLIMNFQKDRIFNLFFKYFGSPISIYSINAIGYVKLVIMARRLLQSYNMIILPYVLSSRIVRFSSKNTINKKELLKIEASPLWVQIRVKYNDNPKIKQLILSEIATILTSEFKFIDLYDKELDGKIIDTIPDILREEYLKYVLLI